MYRAFARTRIIIAFLLLSSAALAQSKVITTIAGKNWSFPTSPLPAASAPMGEAVGTAVDSSGNIYIADPADEYVFKVTPSGTLSIFAGNGVAGVSGDGGPATSASLNNPIRVSVGPAGTVYITEQYNIRGVSPGGVISTFAGNGQSGFSGDGGPATNAALNAPHGVAVNSGIVYIADSLNNRIRRVAGGTISTFAGTGVAGYSGDNGQAASAQLNGPDGLAFDTAGNLYIADANNSVIRKVAPDGTITTVAGNGVAGFSGDGGAATNASLNYALSVGLDTAGNLYIVDQGNNRIREVAGGIITTIAGNGAADSLGDGGPALSASLSRPFSLSVDSTGKVYVAELNSARVRLINAGIISTFAGNGQYYFTGDGGPAVDAVLGYVNAVATDTQSNVYISAQNRIREISSGVIFTVAGSDRGLGNAGDGGLATNATMYYPQGIGLDPVGNLFIADTFNQRIREVTISNGVINTVVGYNNAGCFGDGGFATSATVNIPYSVVADSSGNYYIADSGSNAVRKVDAAGFISTYAGQCFNAGYGGDGGPATSALLSFPTGLALDSSNNLYIADQNNRRIRKVTPGGIITTVAGNGTLGYSGNGGPALSASLNNPQGVAVDADGEIFIADTGNNVIRKVLPQGLISTIAGTGQAGFSGDGGPAQSAALRGPTTVAIRTGDSALIVADAGNFRVRAVTGTVNFNIQEAGTFVTQLYQDLLTRTPDPAGYNYWTGQLNNNSLSRSQVAQQFFQSPEFYNTGLLVIKYYVAALGRDPDYAGWNYWFSQLQARAQTADQVLNAFLASPEFQQTYGNLDNTQFVTLVYNNVLQRNPDQAGLNYWVGQLNSGQTRSYVMNQFIISPEFNNLVTNRALANLLYMGFLRRTADTAGRTYWQGQLDAGVPQATVINGIITSAEYLSRF